MGGGVGEKGEGVMGIINRSGLEVSEQLPHWDPIFPIFP